MFIIFNNTGIPGKQKQGHCRLAAMDLSTGALMPKVCMHAKHFRSKCMLECILTGKNLQALSATSFKKPCSAPCSCRIILLYLVPTIYRFKYYFAWTVAEAGLTMAGLNYNGVNEHGARQWDRFVNTRIIHVEFQTSLAKLPEHWNVCTGLFLRQCKPCRLPLSSLSVQTMSRDSNVLSCLYSVQGYPL